MTCARERRIWDKGREVVERERRVGKKHKSGLETKYNALPWKGGENDVDCSWNKKMGIMLFHGSSWNSNSGISKC